jgi:hypothetical protein
LKIIPAVRNHRGLKIAALLGAVFAFCAQASLAVPITAERLFRGGDEAALRAIFGPALRKALEPLEHLTIEGADDVLFIFRTDRRIKPEDLVARIEEDKKILALFFEAQQRAAG